MTCTGARHPLVAVAITALALGLAGCGDNNESPAGPSVTIGAPTPLSPVSGAQVSAQPTLVANNASVSSGTPTYTFQVAADSAFTNIETQMAGIPQGAGGQTEWEVSPALGDGTHFWRVRAVVGSTTGPLSSAAEFNVSGTGGPVAPGEEVLLYDPLTMGSSVGDVGGGEFTDQGWKVIASSNFIVYRLPTIENGFLEFDITGLDIRNPTRDARHLFFMWDPSVTGDMTSNPFRASLQKLDGRSSISDRWLRLRFISQGQQFDGSSTFRGWIPDQVYHVRFEWGREGESLIARVLINEDQKIAVFYRKPYIPGVLRVELGAAGRAESPEGAIYANVRIGTRQAE